MVRVLLYLVVTMLLIRALCFVIRFDSKLAHCCSIQSYFVVPMSFLISLFTSLYLSELSASALSVLTFFFLSYCQEMSSSADRISSDSTLGKLLVVAELMTKLKVLFCFGLVLLSCNRSDRSDCCIFHCCAKSLSKMLSDGC